MKMLCRLLVVSLLFFSYQSTAGMIGTEQVASAVSAQAERAQIQGTLSRADVASALKSMGVGVKAAQERVAALTDEEARSLAGKIGTLPAGADSDGLWIAVIVVAVALLLWWRWR
jgi:hypothetical protein